MQSISVFLDTTKSPNQANQANRSNLYRSCAFLQNLHTRKLDEITVFYAVITVPSQSHHCRTNEPDFREGVFLLLPSVNSPERAQSE